MTIIVTACGAFSLTVSEKNTKTMCTRGPNQMVEPMKIEAGQKFPQTKGFTYLGIPISVIADLGIKIQRWISLAGFSLRKYNRVLNDRVPGVEDSDA